MELKGSKTEANLNTAFAGESMARNKYSYYASQANKDGYVQISNIFLETADNEKEHAKLWFKALCGGSIPDTVTNLKDAAAGEKYEYDEMYPEFARVAREEGFDDIATLFENVGEVEKHHEARYLAFLKNLEEGVVFKRGEAVMWKCNNCGHIHVGKEAPEECPACHHAQKYFEIRATNW
ncbi:MAG: rubrerythrin [Candidatus Methanomethylophilaceae archaeon]